MPSTELAAALLTVSLANAVLLLWLGMTVLLNAERRTWGMWLAGGALLLGGLFFVMQGSEAAYGWSSVVFAVHFQWPLGWFIGTVLMVIEKGKGLSERNVTMPHRQTASPR